MVKKESKIKISKIKALFFDLDHTLWDFEKNSALTFKELFNLRSETILLHRKGPFHKERLPIIYFCDL